MTTTKAALTFADQIAAIEKLQQSLPKSTRCIFEDEYLPDLDKYLSQMILLMKDWPAESITSKLKKSFDILIEDAPPLVEAGKIYTVSLTVEYLVLLADTQTSPYIWSCLGKSTVLQWFCYARTEKHLSTKADYVEGKSFLFWIPWFLARSVKEDRGECC